MAMMASSSLLISNRPCKRNCMEIAAVGIMLSLVLAFIGLQDILTTSQLEIMVDDDVTKRTGQFITTWSPTSAEPINSHRIYFHGARGRTALAMIKQSCAVESAAKHNPDRPIHLFISTDDPDGEGKPLSYSSDPWLTVLEQYQNVFVIVYNESQYFSGSPFQNWYRKGVWRQSNHRGFVHLSDYWRMLTSYRGGGFYMDLDVITLKPLDEKIFWNFFSLENTFRTEFCSGIFHMEHGHWFMEALIKQLSIKKYDPSIYSNYGPLFVKKMLVTHCGLRLPDLHTNKCRDVKILPHHYFFPIPWEQWGTYFREVTDEELKLLRKRSYGVHVWNKLSGNQGLVKGSKQLYASLAKENCPLTYAAATG